MGSELSLQALKEAHRRKEEQERQFLMDYEAKNGHLPGRAVEEAEPVRLPNPESQPGKVLASAKKITPSPFTLDELTMQCWWDWPKDFSMRGYKEVFPCTRRVYLVLVGPRGLVARGYLKKVAPLTYEVA